MKIKAQELTAETFAPFGSFFNPLLADENGSPKDPIRFYADRLPIFAEHSNHLALSALVLEVRPKVVDVTEYHRNCEEVFGGYAVDTVFHVGLLDKNEEPDIASFKAFILPKGHWARVKRMICHHAPFVMGSERGIGLVILPPFTYTVDCVVKTLEEKIIIE